MRVTEEQYLAEEFQYFDARAPIVELEEDLSQDQDLSISYNAVEHPERYQHDTRAASKQVVAYHDIDRQYIDVSSFPTVMAGALVRIEFRICGEDSSSMVAQVTKLVLLYPNVL